MEGTIILRFRDLVTAPGNTVRDHHDLIESVGYTWWGWWRRPYEAVPYELFADLNDNLPRQIYLLDTGAREDTLKLHRARLDEIAVTPTESDIASPEVSATPRYYNNARFAAWFRLSEISLAPEEGIKSVRVLTLPTWPKQAEADARGTIGIDISTQTQLRNFDVTLWHIEAPNANSAR